MIKSDRIFQYFGFGLLLSTIAIGIHQTPWISSAYLHTLLETLATPIALMVGVLSLIRYYSHAENKYLLVGIGFIGTGLLDGFHATISSVWFHVLFSSGLETVIPWSWLSSRLFLSVMLMLSVITSVKVAQKFGRLFNAAHLYLFTLTVIAISFVLIAFVELPPAYFNNLPVSRPEEYLPALFFLLALIGYARQGDWRKVDIDHWMILALIASLFCQAVFMPFSARLFDTRFDVAHLLKLTSYIFILSGLLISTYKSFKQLEQETLEHRQATLKNKMLVTAIEKSPVAVIVTNAQASIDYCNPKALDMLGYRKEQVIGQNPKIFSSGKTPAATFIHMWETLHRGEDWKGIFFNRRSSGEELVEESHISPIMDENRQITHYVAIKFDATERMQLERDNWHKANYDLLTNLPNRGLFIDRVQSALKNAKRAETLIAVLFIDLNGFKAVNDDHGHLTGDLLLQWVGSQITRSIRESDTVARFGGDEFSILLSDCVEKDEVLQVAEKVLAAINQPCQLRDIQVHISASIGLALFPEDGEDEHILIKKADVAMYRVKKDIRSGVGFYFAE